MVKLVCGNDAKTLQIPLSNDTIHHRIRDMSLNILKQAVEQIKASPEKIGLQLDEKTDVSNCSTYLFFVISLNKGKRGYVCIMNEFLLF